ncbi:MAG: cupin domain-containing protein, partial [Dehalococcoidia bacterium]|nr:cupin domain-containing protein [Dehalococcoidia bacterium]
MEQKEKPQGDEKLAGRVVGIAGLVDYQDGSIVSRQIISKGAGTVTLFAFDRGQGLSEHTAPFDALVYVFDGEAEVVIAGNSHHLSAGEMVIMPANKPHSLSAVRKFKM